MEVELPPSPDDDNVVDSNDNHLFRSRLTVDEKLHDAKLEPDNFLPTAQCIFFNDDLDNDGVRLLELDADLLADLEAGKALTVKGEDDENCVLVTEEKTYELRSAETSNSLLVTKDFVTKDQLKADAERSLGWGLVFHSVNRFLIFFHSFTHSFIRSFIHCFRQ